MIAVTIISQEMDTLGSSANILGLVDGTGAGVDFDERVREHSHTHTHAGQGTGIHTHAGKDTGTHTHTGKGTGTHTHNPEGKGKGKGKDGGKGKGKGGGKDGHPHPHPYPHTHTHHTHTGTGAHTHISRGSIFSGGKGKILTNEASLMHRISTDGSPDAMQMDKGMLREDKGEGETQAVFQIGTDDSKGVIASKPGILILITFAVIIGVCFCICIVHSKKRNKTEIGIVHSKKRNNTEMSVDFTA